MNNPEITVLMPVYNGERYLREAIESMLNQTFKDFEFMIINDCSTDGSREIILSYNDERIRLIDNQVNMGQTKSLNKGLKIARGRYIARMDQDDVSLPNRLEEQSIFLRGNPEIIAVGSLGKYIEKGGRSIDVWRPSCDPKEINLLMLFYNQIGHSSVMMDREAVLHIGGYNEWYQCSQDYELWSEMVRRKYKITNIPKFLFKARIHNHQASVTFRSKRFPLELSEIIHKNISELTNIKISRKESGEVVGLIYNFNQITIENINSVEEKLNGIYFDLCKASGDKNEIKIINRMFSKHYYNIAMNCIGHNKPQYALKAITKSIHLNPFQFKHYSYLLILSIFKKRVKDIVKIKDAFLNSERRLL